MADIIKDPQLKKFIETNVNNDFGLSIDQVAKNCKNYGRFSRWLNSNENRIKEVLNIVKNNGVSPAFFASYERTEGYNSKWGWLNHTSVNGSPENDADSVSRWVKSQSNNTSEKPAWIDMGNPKDFVPENVKQEGNKHFSNLPSGVIGRVVIAGTAAATWEVYYPNGLKKEYNGVQNYGKPITNMMNYIIEWGGKVDGGSGGEKPCFPTSPESVITSPYGWRTNPVTNKSEFHAGTDYASPQGGSQPIYATQSGTVLFAGEAGTAGNMVILKHSGDKYYSRYLHMNSLPNVKKGDKVTKCQKIGDTGKTGAVTGIHLHFEIGISESGLGTEAGTIDPETYLEMSFGGDGNDSKDNNNMIIEMLLVDSLNGWKI